MPHGPTRERPKTSPARTRRIHLLNKPKPPFRAAYKVSYVQFGISLHGRAGWLGLGYINAVLSWWNARVDGWTADGVLDPTKNPAVHQVQPEPGQ
jgi:hypothetical protein